MNDWHSYDTSHSELHPATLSLDLVIEPIPKTRPQLPLPSEGSVIVAPRRQSAHGPGGRGQARVCVSAAQSSEIRRSAPGADEFGNREGN